MNTSKPISFAVAAAALVFGIAVRGQEAGVPPASPSTAAAKPNPSGLPASPPTATLEKAIPLGKWAEGVVVSGGDAFVAESGQRRVVRIDPATGTVKARIAVGRLPVELATGPDGTVYVLVRTDMKIVAINPKTNEPRKVAQFADYPNDMVFADGALWVVLWKDNSSADSTVVRVDPATGKLKQSPRLGGGGQGLDVTGGKVWMSQPWTTPRVGRIVVLDQKTLVKQPDIPVTGTPWGLRATAEAVFVALGSTVVRVNVANGEITHRLETGSRVALVEVAGQEVFVASEDGTIRQLDADSMAVKSIFHGEEASTPHGMVRSGPHLLVTRHDEPENLSETGNLLVIRLP